MSPLRDLSKPEGEGHSPALLSRLFPGAAIEDWRPIIEPKGRAKELLGHLTGIPPGKAITKAELMERMGFNHLSQLNKLLKHRDIEGVLEAEGRRLKIDHKAVATELAPKLLPF